MTTRIKLRRDTAANWVSHNPILALGEAGYDSTNNKIKVGNGTSTWTQLSYLAGSSGGGIGDTADSIQLTGTIPYVDPVLTAIPVEFTRPNNSPNTVDAIDTGLTLKRGNQGALYNSAGGTETSYNSSVSPRGTRWNADGWGDLADVKTRTYTNFTEVVQEGTWLAAGIHHKELVMHDTINDKYYTFKFSWWQANGGGGAGQSMDQRSGFSYVRQLIDTDPTVYLVHPGGDQEANQDEIGPGLTITRGENGGGIYNASADQEWDPDNTPSGTLWNDEGWDDFEDITTRTWKPFFSAVHGRLGVEIVGRELLMQDTINDKYYLVKFTEWGINNGGSFAYWRREVHPTGTKLGIVFADGSVQKTANLLGDLRVVDSNTIENQAQPGHGAEIRYDVKNNYYFNTGNWAGTTNWVTSGDRGYIQFDNGDPTNGNQTNLREFLDYLGHYMVKTVRINGGEPQVVNNSGNSYIYTEAPPATDPTVVTEISFDLVFRSRLYMGGENTVGFFLNQQNEYFRIEAREVDLYAGNDVRINGRNWMEIRNNGTTDGVRIVTDGDNTAKTWRFLNDGSIQLPSLDNTGYRYNYSLNGHTLRLGDSTDQTIITGAVTSENYPSAQRLIIQGQRGYGTWGQNTAGEGGDVYIWGGTGGERDNGGGGSGGDVKLRGGQGQDAAGGYVRIEAGDAAHWGGNYTGGGGFVEINAGNVIENGGDANNQGGPVTITAGKAKNDDTKSGNIVLRTGGSVDNNSTMKSWTFDNGGTLHLPTGGDILNSSGASVLGNGGNVSELIGSGTAQVGSSLAIATNYDGQLIGWNSNSLSVAYNADILITYAIGSTITWQDGTTATITGFDPYAPTYIDVFWDTPKTGDLFPITLKTSDYVAASAVTARVIVTDGTPSGPTVIGGSSGSWESNPRTDLATTGGTGTGLTVNVTETGGYASTIDIANPGTGYADGDVITVTSGSSTAGFTISVPVNQWTFNANGNLTLPQGSRILDGNSPAWGYKSIDLYPGDAPCPDQYLRIYPTVGGDQCHLHLTSGNLQLAELFLGNDDQYVKLVSTGAVDIRSDDMAGNSAVWAFGTDGSMSLPTGPGKSEIYTTNGGYQTVFETYDPQTGKGKGTGQSLTLDYDDAAVKIHTWPGKEWKFDQSGTTTLPGAVVNSTVAKTGTDPLANDVLFQVTQVDGFGAVTEAVVTNSPNPSWVSNTSGLALGDVNFTVNFDGSGNATVIINSSGTGHSTFDSWSIPAVAVGATAPLPTAIDLTKSINKLTDGNYTLADGVEGQTMHLVAQTGITPGAVNVTVANYRFGGTRGYDGGLYPFRILNDADSTYYDSRAFCTLIFADGAWQQSGGSWD